VGLHFLDTSALAKLYIKEPGSEEMLAIARNPANRLAVLSVAQAELHSALRRRQRHGDLPADETEHATALATRHFYTRYLRQVVSDLVVDRACVLLQRHPLRAYDAVQLAACLVLSKTTEEALLFVCSDRGLLNSAKAEGLKIWDPTHPA